MLMKILRSKTHVPSYETRTRSVVGVDYFGCQISISTLFLGPDAQNSCQVKMTLDKESDSYLQLELHTSELLLRGTSPIVQPHVHDGNILCWNGEVIYLARFAY